MERPATTEDLHDESRTWALDEETAHLSDGPPSRMPTRHDGDQRDRSTAGLPSGGFVLDRYRLEGKLGAGGFGVVYRAWDEKLEREVAVKVIPKDGDGPVPARASREARVAARLNHPGIVALYELGQDDDAVYLVSELVHGRTFADLMRGGALSDRDVAKIGSALCDALAHAHAKKVIHRDVKPQNVIVEAEPAAGAGFAKLTDFGIAHLAVGDPLTRTGDVVGTLAYMAPEQAEGERVTEAADVYSLALMLYEGWTGVNPVRGNGPVATARRLGTHLPPLRSRRRELPDELGSAIDAALDPRPDFRPTLPQLRKALGGVDDDLSDEGGLVEPATLERFGLTRVGRARVREPIAADSRTARVAMRAAAGAATGALTLAGLTALGPTPPFSALLAAAVVAVVTAVFPRIGWIAGACVVIGWLGSPDANREGTALMVTAAVLPIPLLLPRAGLLWSLPALAPLLGAAGVAPLYVAFAALAPSPWRRAGAAAAGVWWLILAEAVTGNELLFGAPYGVEPHSAWQSSLSAAATDGLFPTLASSALLPAAVWALFAFALPIFVRGRALVLDILGACVWAAGLIAAHTGLARLMAGDVPLADARGLVAGALLAVVAAVVAAGAGLVSPPRDEENFPPRIAGP
jgi:serine/threonine protein kinase